MYRVYEGAERELMRSIEKEKGFWKRLGKVLALNELLKKTF